MRPSPTFLPRGRGTGSRWTLRADPRRPCRTRLRPAGQPPWGLVRSLPGYPYLAVAFQSLGLIRLAPLFYGALACLGLYAGGRRWLGRFGGAAAVGLYCSSGAAILFAWRDYMPTFTGASLIAAVPGPCCGWCWRPGRALGAGPGPGWPASWHWRQPRSAGTPHRGAGLRGHRGTRGVAAAGPGGCPVARSPGGSRRSACSARASRSSTRWPDLYRQRGGAHRNPDCTGI